MAFGKKIPGRILIECFVTILVLAAQPHGLFLRGDNFES
jgi:hypothetical protein